MEMRHRVSAFFGCFKRGISGAIFVRGITAEIIQESLRRGAQTVIGQGLRNVVFADDAELIGDCRFRAGEVLFILAVGYAGIVFSG